MIIRRLVMIACSICVLMTSAACNGQSLADGFDEDEVKQLAVEVISMVHEQDSNRLREISVVQMRNALTDDVLAGIFEAISEGGAFVSIQDLRVMGSTDQTSGEAYAVVVVKAKYEIKSIIYTITFTKQLKLAGLYYR